MGKLRSNNFFGSKNTLGKAFLPVTSHAVAHTRTNGREREIGIWVWQKRWHRWWCDAIMLVWRSSPNRFIPGQLISGMLLQVSSSANLLYFWDNGWISMATAWWPNSSSRWWLRVAYLFGCDCSSFVDVDFCRGSRQLASSAFSVYFGWSIHNPAEWICETLSHSYLAIVCPPNSSFKVPSQQHASPVP